MEFATVAQHFVVEGIEVVPRQRGGRGSDGGEARGRVLSGVDGTRSQGGDLGVDHRDVLHPVPVGPADRGVLAEHLLGVAGHLRGLPVELEVGQAEDRRAGRIDFELVGATDVAEAHFSGLDVAGGGAAAVGHREVVEIGVGGRQLARGGDHLGDETVLLVELLAVEQGDEGVRAPDPLVEGVLEQILRLEELILEIGEIESHDERRVRTRRVFG